MGAHRELAPPDADAGWGLIMPQTAIFTELEAALAKYPDNTALQMFTDDGAQRFTHREIHDLARKLRSSLVERGMGKGDRAVFWARLVPRWVVAYLAALRGGAVIVPLDVEYGKAELSPVLARTAPRFIFTVREKLGIAKEAAAGLPHAPTIILLDSIEPGDDAVLIDDLFTERESYPDPPQIDPEDVGTIFFTSGTTGKPKGVVIQHRAMNNSVSGLMQYLEVDSTDSALAVIPSHHIFAALANVLVPLAKGGAITFVRQINSAELMSAMSRGRVTVFPAVPQVFYLLHKKIFDEVRDLPLAVRLVFRLLLNLTRLIRRTTGLNPGPRLFGKVHRIFGGHLRLLVSAASYFDPKVIRDFYSLGFDVQQGYALTETFGGGTFTPANDNVIGSVGRAIPGVEIRILDPDESGVGEILISGPSLMQGYLDDPEATAAVVRDGWFHTGDLGSVDRHGNVFIRGRRKEMIVLSSGKNIYPEEIEQHYLQIPHIAEMCVLGVSEPGDYARSERLHAVIVPNFDYLKQHHIVNSKEIIREGIEEYSAYLPKYKRILTYEIRTEPLPRTASRKIQRFLVKPHSANGDGQAPEKAAYRNQEGDDLLLATDASRRALEIIKRETALEAELHPDMNLELDLGFDSLQRIELLAQIEAALGVRLGDEVASQVFTLRDLLGIIERRIREGAASGGAGAQAARVTWREIIASAETDDMAARYIIEPSTISRVVHFLALKLIYLLGVIFFRLRVSGIENLPADRPFLICPNHQSYLDGPLVSASIPYRVIRHMFTLGFTPFFSGGFKDLVARVSRIVPVDADTNLGRAMRISAIGLKAQQNLLIFPEGGLSCDGQLQKFKKGVGILAGELGIPIVPVAVKGSFQAWSKVGDRVRFVPVSITFGQPIHPDPEIPRMDEPEKEYERLASAIRDAISRMLDQQPE
ncbi:MAG: AMP-binding protein [Blastocatellales bacterium]